MVKRLLILVLLLPVTVAVLAQNRTITGTLYDEEMKEHVPFAVVQLLKQDSSYVVVFFNDTAATEIYTLSLHDALPIFNC